MAPAMCPAGNVCARLPTSVCLNANWAQWPMPNGPVDVSGGAPNPENYAVNGDGTVTDKVTGLMWQQVVPSARSWSDALAFCPMLALGGFSDWRMPTETELVSLIDYSLGNDGTHAAVNATAFPSTPTGAFWSSTPEVGTSSGVWIVKFGDGSTNTTSATASLSLRCVR